MYVFRDIIQGTCDLLYPRICLACKQMRVAACAHVFTDAPGNTETPGHILCTRCIAEVRKSVPPFCHSCGRHLENPARFYTICPQCIKGKTRFDRAYSPCLYRGVIRELIHEFKYKGKDYLGKHLSAFMIDFAEEFDIAIQKMDFILPVPLHAARLREREFNQAYILASHIGSHFGKPVARHILQRHRQTKTQTNLDDHNRRINVQGSFSVSANADLQSKNILLIDDVLTTGATASEAAGALKDAGASIVWVMTLAH